MSGNHDNVTEISDVTEDNLMEKRWLTDMVHDGVRCVDCNITPIMGKRFKCDECFDYNLCEECWVRNDKNKKSQPSPSPQPSICRELQLFPSFKRRSLQLSPFNTRSSHRRSISFQLIPTDTSIEIPVTTETSLQVGPSQSSRKNSEGTEDGGPPQKQEHQPGHSFTDVTDFDAKWSRALRLKKGKVFKSIIGAKEFDKYRAVQWVMNKERSTEKTACFLMDMKGERGWHHFITNSDINITSVLIKALRNCWEDLALILTKREVDIDVVDGKKMTPLMVACKTNQSKVVEKLLERNTSGAKYINKKNEEKMTALAIAVANKNDECIKLILKSGVPVDLYYHDKKKLLPLSSENIEDFLDSQINKRKSRWISSSGLIEKQFLSNIFDS